LDSADDLASQIVAARMNAPRERALLVGISGIDGSGKGFVSARLEKRLRELGWNVALLSADGWHSLPNIRFSADNPARTFYERGLRLDEMFEQLILPLRNNRSVDVIADYSDAEAIVHRTKRYLFRNVDIVLLEGIFLFKPAYRDHFDFKVWIDCSFDSALQRAIVRGQEGLPPAATERALQTIYFPAQRLHFEADEPRQAADVVFNNDAVL
jgi:uridine kinase